MIAWINFAVLLAATVLFLLVYQRSVMPAGLEQISGDPHTYQRCGRYRILSGVLEMLITANYVLYYFFPLPVPLARTFPWSWWVSALIALAIALPAGWLMLRGMKDAGRETMTPEKSHSMYVGIYRKIRHPQAVGEVWFFFVLALLLHSPFLVLFSLIYLPIFVIMCHAEEQDLLLRFGQDYADYCRQVPPFIPKREHGNG